MKVTTIKSLCQVILTNRSDQFALRLGGQFLRFFHLSINDLKLRPIYHRLYPRIEAHICIAFVAYKVHKEHERQLKEKGASLSPEKAVDIVKTIYSIRAVTPLNKELVEQALILNEEQLMLKQLFEF